MNWLAHLYLSEPTPAFRVGNLLPDLLPLSGLAALPGKFGPGIECHRRIDSFTDAHPVVRRSIGRFSSPYRRFGGILTDVFYDHLLAHNWNLYAAISLEEFATEAYASFDSCREDIPFSVSLRLQGMKDYNWLVSYREMSGIQTTLQRIGSRFKRPVDLGAAMEELELHYAGFQMDFDEFFPELSAHIEPTLNK